MTDHRKVINPLLNVSVTGATVEDFSQHAVLLPAAQAPPVLKPPSPATLCSMSDAPVVPTRGNDSQPIDFGSVANNNHSETAATSHCYCNPLSAPVQQPAGAFLQECQHQSQSAQSIHEIADCLNSNFAFQRCEERQQQEETRQQLAPSTAGEPPVGLQSVFSSFSSYLKLGGRPQEQDIAPVPSVVDGLLASASPNAFATPPAPVQFYSPDPLSPSAAASLPAGTTAAAPPLSNAHAATAGLNSYRRGGFKRPTYAPIPGLSTQNQALAQVPSQFPAAGQPRPPATANLPSGPSATFSPPFVPAPRQTPSPQLPVLTPQLRTIPAAVPVPLVAPLPSAPPPAPARPAAQTPPPPAAATAASTQHVEPPSPFLTPVSVVEAIQLAAIPSRPSSVPTLDTSALTPTIVAAPSSYYPVSFGAAHTTHPDMSQATGDAPAHAEPILTHTETAQIYRPVYHHWFHKSASEAKPIWTPFSMMDSLNLDAAYLSPDLRPEQVVATDGGRFDVSILRRERVPAYWEGAATEVRRCSWFYKGGADGRYVPYEENVAAMLEEEFKAAFEAGAWNRRVGLANGESVVLHAPDVLVLFPRAPCADSWGNTPNQPRPRVVKRGLDEFHIDEGEPAKVDHLLFMVHGIGKFCDLKFRGVEEAVDDFRSMALQLVQSHYRSSCEREAANRIEILPISWHGKLHSEETGVDKKLKAITLESIPRLREFTNDTILDVLFYTSPVYCQTVIASVGSELNRIYELFQRRNPAFAGGVSLAGHSLGSLILFDLLCHQRAEPERPAADAAAAAGEDELSPLKPPPHMRTMSRRISYMMAQIGTGQAQIGYPRLAFQPRHFFALGSPVGMFVTVRGLESLGEQFALPTCPAYFNIFHPYDPVAFRIEALINPELAALKPVLIPHHKGRKRMHLELKETMARVGADLKQKLIDSMKSTWNSFYQFTLFKGHAAHAPSLEAEVDKVLEAQLKHDNGNASDEDSILEAEHTDLSLGQLNGGRRIDYVLQEAPLEFFNEYIFALTSHVCYWESNDTILLIVKEIYSSLSIAADSQIPQQTMTIERTAATSAGEEASPAGRGMDPTMPMHSDANIGPPPLAGFVRKV